MLKIAIFVIKVYVINVLHLKLQKFFQIVQYAIKQYAWIVEQNVKVVMKIYARIVSSNVNNAQKKHVFIVQKIVVYVKKNFVQNVLWILKK